MKKDRIINELAEIVGDKAAHEIASNLERKSKNELSDLMKCLSDAIQSTDLRTTDKLRKIK